MKNSLYVSKIELFSGNFKLDHNWIIGKRSFQWRIEASPERWLSRIYSELRFESSLWSIGERKEKPSLFIVDCYAEYSERGWKGHPERSSLNKPMAGRRRKESNNVLYQLKVIEWSSNLRGKVRLMLRLLSFRVFTWFTVEILSGQ